MKRVREIKALIRKKNGNRLLVFSVVTMLIMMLIVFTAVLALNSWSKLKMLGQYIQEVPKIAKEREIELDIRSAVFEEDVLARGELGLRIWKEEGSLPAEERLELVRTMVAADSVSLVDADGSVLETTGIVMPEEQFFGELPALEPRTPVLETYPAAPEEETEKKDGKTLALLPLKGNVGQTLVFEFSCEPLMEIYNSLGDWSGILERMLSGLEIYSFVRTGDDVIGYPLDAFTDAQREQLKSEVADVFKKSSRFHPTGNGYSWKLVTLLHYAAIALYMPYPAKNAEILLALPLWDFICTGVYCAVALSVFIAMCLILFTVYVVKYSEQKQDREDREIFRRELSRMTRPGRYLALAGVACFTLLLLLLESRATIAYIGTTKRLALQNEIVLNEEQGKVIRSAYSDIYRTRSEALARFLTEHKEFRTHIGLQALAGVLKADYVMLFDRNGKELVSSNSYTGFSVNGPGANMSEGYRAVLLGYPYAVVGPEEDPYTGKQQIGAAVLLTEDDGTADGFLLSVFDADAMNSELKKVDLENTVNTFAVVKGYEAAVVDKENGRFLAHTDRSKIGLEAAYFFGEEVYSDDFAGFTDYGGRNMYVSGVSEDGKNLMFMVPERTDNKEKAVVFLLVVVLLLIIAFVYCPKAAVLSVLATDRENPDIQEEEHEKLDKKNPWPVFAYGFIVYFTVLAGAALTISKAMYWPAFMFVFGGMWSRGVHLFSVWAALFFLACVLFVEILIRTLLSVAGKRTNYRTRTALMLADSFVAYATGILLVSGILYMFGVNTTALLASAGILSIAIGMGAKDMVADILAGLFLAIEDSIHLGDVVTVGSWKGRVTEMGIRTTKITDDSQNVKILNNSHISDVINMSRQKTSCVMELGCARIVSMFKAENILRMAAEAASDEMPELYGSLNIEGIYNITDDGFTARLSYACSEVERESATKRLRAFMEKYVREEMELEAEREREEAEMENKSSE